MVKEKRLTDFVNNVIVATLERYNKEDLKWVAEEQFDISGTLNSVIDSSLANLLRSSKDSDIL